MFEAFEKLLQFAASKDRSDLGSDSFPVFVHKDLLEERKLNFQSLKQK